MIEKGAELDERFDSGTRTIAMLDEHHALGSTIATSQSSNQQAVMLIEFLHRCIRCTMQFYQSLLTTTTQQGSIHG